MKPAPAARKQSTEKVHPCPYPDCGKWFARTFNIREHVAKVHMKERPFVCHVNGCPKETKGYCRQFDLDNHLRKKHDIEPPVRAPTRRGAKQTQAAAGAA
ncbi:hypothetical protein BV20DRAFT_966358 [Pilatotrama ljubarskyi]|nr:hypothetical protein BV20DRAFT_966358 [Pilatotrama ljubarskyi]